MFLLSTSENILLFVSGFGTFQGIFSAALLYYHPKSDRSVNRFLSLYVLSLTLPIILPLVLHLFTWQVIIFIEPFITFIPVSLYFYIRSFKEVITWKKAWPHLLVFFVCIVLAIWVYISIGSKYPPSHAYAEEAKQNMFLLVPYAIRIVQRIVYYFLSLRELKFYQHSIVHLFSDISQINLNWMKWLINGFLFITATSLFVYFSLARYPEYFDWTVLISGVIIALYIFMVVFKGMTQTTLWQVHPHISKEVLEKEINNAGQMELRKTNETMALHQKTA